MHEADLQHSQKSLQEKLQHIFQLRRTRSKVNWDRGQFLSLLEKLGNPHLSLPPVIHVAGTNGKGSVISMLRAILVEAGYRVHVYTSPHLIKVNERIVLDNQMIGDEELERRMDEVIALNDDAPLSFFEITTALAFKAFSEHSADVLLLEVGMGGELDCTNVIDRPLCCIINRISYDHTDFLGDDIEKIAQSKAGIMKSGIPCVVGDQGGDDANVIYAALDVAAKKYGAALSLCDKDWRVSIGLDDFSYDNGAEVQQYKQPALVGAHQLMNAGVVLRVLEEISTELPASKQAINAGFEKVTWPGRLQHIPASCFDLPQECSVWLDSAHNDSAGSALAIQMQKWRDEGRKVHMVMAMLQTKNPTRFLEPILPLIDSLNVVPIHSDPNCHTLASLQEAIQELSVPEMYGFSSFQDALHTRAQEEPDAVIVIAGSVYLCGEVLSHLNN